METIWINRQDDVSVRIECNQGLAMDLSEAFSFFVPGYKYMPRYKARVWDGKIRLFNPYSNRFPVGLLPRLFAWAETNRVKIEAKGDVLGHFLNPDYNEEELQEFLDSLVLTAEVEGQIEEIFLNPHQTEAIHEAVKTRRVLILSPTSSGKSLIMYCLVRWQLREMARKGELHSKILILVPTTTLVEQLFKDFAIYSLRDEVYQNDSLCHRIYSGKEKRSPAPIYISTWQSVYKLKDDWFMPFRSLIIDECHTAKGQSIQTIAEMMTDCPLKAGFTGTLDETGVNQLVLESVFGVVRQFVTTRDLMDKGIVAQLKIRGTTLKYSEEDRAIVAQMSYQEEMKFIENHAGRTEFIGKMVSKLKGNTLVLFTKREHGERLAAAIQKHSPHKRVTILHGANSTAIQRLNESKKIDVSNEEECLVCSYGTFSTGVSMRNIHHLVFGAGSKGRIRNMQSIGRGLRVSKTKFSVTLWDIVDDLSTVSKKTGKVTRLNHSVRHFLIRVKYYDEEKFDYQTYEVDL